MRYNKEWCAVFMFLFLFASCRPRLKWPKKPIYIAADKNIKIISAAGEYPAMLSRKQYMEENTTGFRIYRSDKAVPVVVQIDSIQKTVFLKPRKQKGWFLNWKCVCGCKDRSDTFPAKCWTFRKKNYIVLEDGNIRILHLKPEMKNAVYGTFSCAIPVFNLATDKRHYTSGGILGIEAGADYFYSKSKFVSMAIGAGTDILPLPIDYFGSGYIERAGILYAAVRNNFVLGDFDAGYGINISRFFYSGQTYGDTVKSDISIKTTALGLSFSFHYKIMRNLRVGVLYQPNLINLGYSPAFSYQHYLALQLVLKLSARK
jgi:hypothetical protein